MASLSEMLQYADYSSKTANPLAGIAESGLGGYIAGRQSTQQLDTALKIIELQEKVEKIKTSTQRRKIEEDVMKSADVLSMDASDHSSAVAGAWSILGSKGPKLPNTAEGKLAGLANSGKWYVKGWSEKSGLSLGLKSQRTVAERDTDKRIDEEKRVQILKAAHEMAVDEEFNRQKKSNKNPNFRKSDVTVGPSAIHKFYPTAEALFMNDKKALAKIFASVPDSSPSDPKAGLIAATAAEYAKLKAKSKALQTSSTPSLAVPWTDQGADDSE